MKKFLKLVIFLTLSTFSFANWEVDREHDMIFTYSIKSEPTQKGVLFSCSFSRSCKKRN